MKANNLRIFILDDDIWYGSMLHHHLSMNPDFEVRRFDNSRDFFNYMHECPDVVTLDLSMPDMHGSEILKKIRISNPETQVLIVSSEEDLQMAVSLLKNGASDYIVKGKEAPEQLWKTIHQMNEIASLRKEVINLKKTLGITSQLTTPLLHGSSEAILRVTELIEKAASSNITVSITGETGTGKEMAARAIHQLSARKDQPFVAVNLAAIPHELLESELFGHEKGAFTGAISKRIGKFEEAQNGTLFLDEIGELDIHLQAKLLRVLQEREFCRVGSNQLVSLNIRIITATHKDLSKEVKEKRFREDLYYRLKGLPIQLPALRERGQDILLLANHFITQFCTEEGFAPKKLTAQAKEKLMRYSFPGNVRELRSLMELAVVLSDDDYIGLPHVQMQNIETNEVFQPGLTLEAYEIRIIQSVLDLLGGDVLAAAAQLQIGKSTIYRMIQAGKVSTGNMRVGTAMVI